MAKHQLWAVGLVGREASFQLYKLRLHQVGAMCDILLHMYEEHSLLQHVTASAPVILPAVALSELLNGHAKVSNVAASAHTTAAGARKVSGPNDESWPMHSC